MEIKLYESGNESQIKILFEKVFKQPYSLDLWRWRFEKNPFGKRKIMLMWDKEELVGQYAVSPVSMNFSGVNINTALSLATMTHPDYEGKGVFKSLAKSLYASLNNEGFHSVWGFPNNNSHGGFVNSLGWKNIAVQHSLGIKYSMLSSHEIISNFNQFQIFKFESKHEEFIKGLSQNLEKFRINKNVDYLNWRYCDKPLVNYHKYFGNINGINFLIIVKVYDEKSSNLKTLNILELHIQDYSILHSLLNNVVNSLDTGINFINIWKNLFDLEHSKLERVGFTVCNPQTYLGILPLSDMFQQVCTYNFWDINMGDSDVF